MMKKHILIIADGRSAITTRWIELLRSLDYRVSLVSSYPLSNKPNVDNLFILPVAFSAAGEVKQSSDHNNVNSKQTIHWKRQIIQYARPLAMKLRYWLGPYTLPNYQNQLLSIISTLKPDLVHALRIPYEGMLACITPQNIPLLVSVWGNDFTLHANANQKMKELTRSILNRTNGLIADVHRDINLSFQLGFSCEKPSLVVPGGGGIHLSEILTTANVKNLHFSVPDNTPVIVNPRGIRAYAQTDVFFQSIPIILQELSNAIFLCPAMEGKPEANHWVENLKIQKNVNLLPSLPQHDLWSYFHQSQISVSLTTHDGTPNTLLETMACGCFPICGDIESIREWIVPGVNGFLVSPYHPEDLANAVIQAFRNQTLREKAKKINQAMIVSRADANQIKDLISDFYAKFF